MGLAPEARVFMEARYPEVARRWLASSGVPARHGGRGRGAANPKSVVGVSKPPKRGAFERDFGPLKPSSSARHRPAGKATPNEHEAMSEGTGLDFQVGSRHRELGVPVEPKGLLARDVRVAAAHKVLQRPKGRG
jgi:hypothetical protein